MKAVIYTRVSGDDQVDGTSLTSQDEVCRKYCEQKGFEIAAIFVEEGESAKDLSLKNRSQFLAALEFCRKEKDIKAFVVFKVDRFARKTEDHFAVRRLLLNYGTALHSVTEPIGDRPAEKFIETVLAGAAEYDNAVRKQRCTDGLIGRIKQGIWPFKPPVGYTCARHRSHGEKKTIPDAPDGKVFTLIQRALRAYDSGDAPSQAALVALLDQWGYAELTGSKVTPQRVDKILGRYLPFYAGLLVNPWTGDEVPGAHTPMITLDEFASIRARRAGRARKNAPLKRTYFNKAFPLRRMLRCANCGKFVTGARSSGNGGAYEYYYCINKACDLRSKTISGPTVHRAFKVYLKNLYVNTEKREPVDTQVRRLIASRVGRTANSDQARESQMKELAARRARLFDMREDGSYDQETFRDRLRAVDAELATLKPQTALAPSLNDLDAGKATEAVSWFLAKPFLIWKCIAPASRLRFERLAFPDGIRYHGTSGFRTTEPGLAFALVSSSDSHESSSVCLWLFELGPSALRRRP